MPVPHAQRRTGNSGTLQDVDEHLGERLDGAADSSTPPTTSRRPRVLMTLADAPWPPNSGKRIRARTALEALARIADVDVVVIFPGSDDVHAPPNVELRSFQTVPVGQPARSRAGLRLLSGRPWRLANQDWASAEQVIGNLDPGPFDLVWFGLVDHAYALGPAVRARRSIVDLDDIETDKIHSQLAMPTDMDGTTRAERTQRRIELPMWARIERLTVRSADRVLVCSERDRILLDAPNISVVPNTYPEPSPPVTGERDHPNDIVMVANYDYEPNLDGAVFMAHEVLPEVRAAHPDTRLVIVGKGGDARLSALNNEPGVNVIGPVDDPGDYLRHATITVAPLRFGGGTRVKLIEAFAYGLASVTTTLGCTGLAVEDGREVLIRDDPHEFAQAVIGLLGDRDAVRRMGRSARALYERDYRPEVAKTIITTVAREVLAG